MAFKQALNTPVTTTANGALAFDGTGSALVDHFSTVTARTHKESNAAAMSDDTIRELTAKAYQESPELCARLIAHLRDCRGGKGERHAAHVAWTWWLEHYPEQATAKLEHLPFYGCFRDLPNWFSGTEWQATALHVLFQQLEKDWDLVEQTIPVAEELLQEVAPALLTTEPENLESFIKRAAAIVPSESQQELHKQLLGLLSTVTLAGKWAPRENSSDDKRAKKVQVTPPSFVLASMWTVDRRVYRRRCAVLTSLCNVVEVPLCAKRPEEIDLSKVPSKALHLYGKKCFPQQLGDKYYEWLAKAQSGEVKVNTGQVDPYEVISPYVDGYQWGGPDGGTIEVTQAHEELAELFFRKQVEEMRQKYGEQAMDESVVVLDTSGSMHGPPMKAGMGLAMWLSACASEAWRNMFISFSQTPAIISYSEESSLKERTQLVMTTEWGWNTNLQSTAELMVTRAKLMKVKRSEMPKRVVIISDMQFDGCGGTQTNYDAYCKVFRDAGYNVPTIVFWNVSGRFDGKAAPARAFDEGVIMLSGFSKELMSILIDNEPIPTPYDIMIKTLSNERYDRMV